MPLPLLAGLGAKFALGGGIKGLLGRVPRVVWLGLAAAVVIFISYKLIDRHFHRGLETARTEARKARDVEWQGRLDKAHADALAWKQKYTVASTQLATARRQANEKELNAIGARRDTLLMRGPGAASAANCRPINNPGTSTSSSGRVAASGPVVSGVAGMPSNEPMAIVPWNELVRRGALCDANRSESLTWRAHDAEQRALRHGSIR